WPRLRDGGVDPAVRPPADGKIAAVTDPRVATRGLRKWFGPTVAVADLSLSVHAGEIFGFLGPNGAGKSTTVKMLLGLVEPTDGTATVLAAPLGDRRVRARIGFLPEHFRFHDCL